MNSADTQIQLYSHRQIKKIGIVAGELSGDQLGGGLISELKKHYPDAVFEGIGGPQMEAQGFFSLFPLERLSVMGFVEPLKRLPELIKIRRYLFQYFLHNQFDLVLGIDSPDFNLGLEKKLRRAGIKTAHYVSPSVWAWRQGRIKGIRRSVDLMITLLPFEAEFYHKHHVPVVCVGHPLADTIPLETDTLAARQSLDLPLHQPILTLMPGSRQSEVAALGSLFLNTAERCAKKISELHIVIPAANDLRYQELKSLIQAGGFEHLPLTLISGQSHQAMAAADVVLLASGTSALEAMLLKKPMVVSYRPGKWTFKTASKMVKVPWVALPNLLAGKPIVRELLQEAATVSNLTSALLPLFTETHKVDHLKKQFVDLHRSLQHGGNTAAANALVGLIEK